MYLVFLCCCFCCFYVCFSLSMYDFPLNAERSIDWKSGFLSLCSFHFLIISVHNRLTHSGNIDCLYWWWVLLFTHAHIHSLILFLMLGLLLPFHYSRANTCAICVHCWCVRTTRTIDVRVLFFILIDQCFILSYRFFELSPVICEMRKSFCKRCHRADL